MFNFFKKKPLSHNMKLAKAYSFYKEDKVQTVFPNGITQADIVLKSLAKVLNVNLDQLGVPQYYDILKIYTDTLIRIFVTKSTDDAIMSALLSKHTEIIHSKEIARRILAYCILNINDHYFGLNSDADFYQLDILLSQSNVSQEKPSVGRIFDDAYLAITNCLSTFAFIDKANIHSETALLLVTLSDYASMCVNAERNTLHIQAKEWIFDLHSECKLTLSQRMNFYGEIIRGKELRGEWLLSDSIPDNPILRCITAFGDIIINPACTEDYDSAPIRVLNITEAVSFGNALQNEITSIISEFCKDITK